MLNGTPGLLMPAPDDPSPEEREAILRDAETNEPLSMERCAECGALASVWHKLGCSRDPDRQPPPPPMGRCVVCEEDWVGTHFCWGVARRGQEIVDMRQRIREVAEEVRLQHRAAVARERAYTANVLYDILEMLESPIKHQGV